MHILLIHQAFAALGEPGGTRHHEMARRLCEDGHRVTIITSQISYLTGQKVMGSREVTDDAGVVIRRAYTYRGYHRSFFHRVFSFISFMASSFFSGLQVRGVDVVWGTSPPIFQGVTAWLLARLKRAAFLFEVRDLWPYFAIAVGVLRQPLLIRLSLWLERWLYRKADQVVVNSPGYVEHVRARGARDVALIPNGVDTEMFDPALNGDAFRQAHALGGKFIALYAGAHGMSNDLDVVLDAAEKLSGRDDIAIVLLGDGKEKERLQVEAGARELGNVLFLDPVSKAAIPSVLAAADVCIAILKPIDAYRLTYPNKVFDYMAAGRPVLLAIDGVIRDVVESAGAGVFVPPGDSEALGDAILSLADDENIRLSMGKAGRTCVVERFDRRELSHTMKLLMQEMVTPAAEDGV